MVLWMYCCVVSDPSHTKVLGTYEGSTASALWYGTYEVHIASMLHMCCNLHGTIRVVDVPLYHTANGNVCLIPKCDGSCILLHP